MNAFECIEEYDRRYARAMAALPPRRPWVPAEREEIVSAVRRCLGIREEWVPPIRAEVVRRTEHPGFVLERLRAISWPGTVGAALLYLPAEEKQIAGKLPVLRPLVVLCCGHGHGCKTYEGYQEMARHLVRMGMAVLVPDNIGQGERTPMGHADCVAPFACGTSVQGLIVLETLGWVRWAKADGRFDPSRLAAAGHSGGGTLTVFLAALCPELAALSSAGYPNTFEFVARKEKKHCHCNVLPRIVGEVEMWQVLGCFAPRPLLLFQGEQDHLFPYDLFHATARKVQHVYAESGAAGKCQSRILPCGHDWGAEARALLGDFFRETFGLPAGTPATEGKLLDEQDRCLDSWPADALSTDDLARQVTGVDAPAGLNLWDVYPPRTDLTPLDEAMPRGAGRQVLAQLEAFLATPRDGGAKKRRKKE